VDHSNLKEYIMFTCLMQCLKKFDSGAITEAELADLLARLDIPPIDLSWTIPEETSTQIEEWASKL
jgi:hypothetical protein